MLASRSPAHPIRRSAARARLLPFAPRPEWSAAGALALLFSTVAWASLPRPVAISSDDPQQWQALGIAPLSKGGATGMAMAPTDAAEPIAYAPRRPAAVQPATPPEPEPLAVPGGPVRIRGVAGDGLYWALRSAGAAPETAAQYLAALATEIDVGEVAPGDRFDLVLGSGHQLLYAGLNRIGRAPLQLVRWSAGSQAQWIDATNADQPSAVEGGLVMPVDGHVTSYFGYRYHPILHFTRFHAGLDIGANWGSPIVAAADGRVIAAGWAGGYGREVQIAHGGGMTSLYGHMSQIVVAPGSFVRGGQLIGYVGSSGLSTGPHVHFEVRQSGVPVNPLSAEIVSARRPSPQLAEAVKDRLHALLEVRESSR